MKDFWCIMESLFWRRRSEIYGTPSAIIRQLWVWFDVTVIAFCGVVWWRNDNLCRRKSIRKTRNCLYGITHVREAAECHNTPWLGVLSYKIYVTFSLSLALHTYICFSVSETHLCFSLFLSTPPSFPLPFQPSFLTPRPPPSGRLGRLNWRSNYFNNDNNNDINRVIIEFS